MTSSTGTAQQPSSKLLSAISALAIMVSAAALASSYSLPTVEFEKVLSEIEIYSIYGGIEMLWLDGNPILASIVFVFSMVFPICKLLALGCLWFRHRRHQVSHRSVLWIELLGKWSMLDVFIIGAFVGSIRLEIMGGLQLAKGTSQPGIEVFGAAVLLSMFSTVLVGRLVTVGEPLPLRESPRLNHWWSRLLSTGAALTLGLSLAMPLLEVRKSYFFSNEVALPATTWRMAHEHEVFLAVALMLFVMVTPVLRSVMLLYLRWSRATHSPATLRRAIFMDGWAMVDVFALGLVVVSIKLDQLADTTLLPGFWWVLSAALLVQADAWLLRREVRDLSRHNTQGTADTPGTAH
ncbi:MAG: paraquat-inducible protein A [Pseudohongiellaceae bacterium]|jgi:paraquat-inducible protein A